MYRYKFANSTRTNPRSNTNRPQVELGNSQMSNKSESQPRWDIPRLLDLPVEVVSIILEILLASNRHDLGCDCHSCCGPRLNNDDDDDDDDDQDKKKRWQHTLNHFAPLINLRQSCSALYNITTKVAYSSITIGNFNNGHIYQVVRRLAEDPTRAKSVNRLVLGGRLGRIAPQAELNFIMREAEGAGLRILPLPETTGSKGNRNKREPDFKTWWMYNQRKTKKQPLIYYPRPDRLADSLLMEMLVAMTSSSLVTMNLHYHKNQLPIGTHFTAKVHFPHLGNLSITTDPAQLTASTHEPTFALGHVGAILSRAPNLRSLSTNFCGGLCFTQPHMPSFFNLRYLSFDNGDLTAQDFAHLAWLCPNLVTLRYSALELSRWRANTTIRNGNTPAPPLPESESGSDSGSESESEEQKNRCDRSAFCKAFLPLAKKLKNLSLHLDITSPDYGIDCDFRPYTALEALSLGVQVRFPKDSDSDGRPPPQIPRDALIRVFPAQIQTVTLMGITKIHAQAVDGLVQVLKAGKRFPKLRRLCMPDRKPLGWTLSLLHDYEEGEDDEGKEEEEGNEEEEEENEGNEEGDGGEEEEGEEEEEEDDEEERRKWNERLREDWLRFHEESESSRRVWENLGHFLVPEKSNNNSNNNNSED